MLKGRKTEIKPKTKPLDQPFRTFIKALSDSENHLKAYKLDLSVAIIRPGRELSLLKLDALTVESLMSNPSISVCGNCSEACRDVGSIDCGCYLLLSFYGLTSQSTAMVM